MDTFKRYFFLSFILLFSLVFSYPLQAQTFSAGIIAGVNASQLTGDDFGGYNKVGFTAGLRGIALLSEKWDLSVDLLYSQRGSRSNKFERIPVHVINLAYAEIPVLIHFKDWYQQEDEYHKIYVQAGLSVGRLISAKPNIDSAYSGVEDNFEPFDLGLVLGATFFANRHVGISAQYNRSINRLFVAEKFDDDPTVPALNSLVGYFLSFKGIYIF